MIEHIEDDFDLSGKPCSGRPSLINDDIIKIISDQSDIWKHERLRKGLIQFNETFWTLFGKEHFVLFQKWIELLSRQ